jgi:predicted lipid carrier protein YhbT
MSVSLPQTFVTRMPRAIAALPGIRRLPWPGPLRYLPKSLQLVAAERLCNRLLGPQLDDGELDFLEGATLRVQVHDLGFDWGITLQDSGLRFSAGDDSAKTTFCGNSREFLLLAGRREDPDTLFFQRRLTIEGDTEMGLEVKNLIDAIDLDELPALVNQVLSIGADLAERLSPEPVSV